MLTRRTVHGVLLALAIGAAGPGLADDDGGDLTSRRAPLELGIEERTARRLVQLDVTVTGPDDVVSSLTAEDFEFYLGNVTLGGSPVDELHVDRICPLADAARPALSPSAPTGLTYLFFFDQPHLTMRGRARSLELARELIDELIPDAGAAMIVSTGRELRAFAGLTADRDELLRALDDLEHDAGQVDAFAEAEDGRVASVMHAWRHFGWRNADNQAARFQKEEISRAHISLRRFRMVLDQLADLDSPKVVFYFADTMRSRPGQYYFELLGKSLAALDIGDVDPFAAAEEFDAAIASATASGVRIFSIEARGLINSRSRQHFDAQASLAGLAKETGGRHFLGGVTSERIVQSIRDDLSCVYLLSFDPDGFPVDRRLGVMLRVNRPKVDVKARRQLTLRSAATRDEIHGPALDYEVTAAVIPTGFTNDRYRAVVQVSLPPLESPDADWEIGVSILAGGLVQEEASGHASLSGAGVPVILETEMLFPAGPYELMVTARERAGDLRATGRLSGEWPVAGNRSPTVGPIVVLQPAQALFIHDGHVTTDGLLAQGVSPVIRPARRTVLAALICELERRHPRSLLVERRLDGHERIEFAVRRLDLDRKHRCTAIRDEVPAGALAPGRLVYEILVKSGEQELSAIRHPLLVGPDTE